MRLSLVTYLVRDTDAAIAWFQDALGWIVLEDTDLGEKRWVRVAPDAKADTALLIAQASTDAQVYTIGTANAGRVSYFLEVEDFDAAATHLNAHGALFEEEPRRESYGRVAVFRDPLGYRWDLIEPSRV